MNKMGKRILATALVASFCIGCTVNAQATSGMYGVPATGPGSASESIVTETINDSKDAKNETSKSEAKSEGAEKNQTDATKEPAAETKPADGATEAKPADSKNDVVTEGKGKINSVDNVINFSDIPSVKVLTTVDEIEFAYGVRSDSTICAKVLNLGDKKPVTKGLLETLVNSQKADAGVMLNIQLGYMESGKFKTFEQGLGLITLCMQIPEDFIESGSNYDVVAIKQNGEAAILTDLDDDPSTVTIDTDAGVGAYALIRY